MSDGSVSLLGMVERGEEVTFTCRMTLPDQEYQQVHRREEVMAKTRQMLAEQCSRVRFAVLDSPAGRWYRRGEDDEEELDGVDIAEDQGGALALTLESDPHLPGMTYELVAAVVPA